MPGTVRRVVTGHDSDGRAVVLIDEACALEDGGRAGVSRRVAWTTEGFPVDNSSGEDTSGREIGTTLVNGTVFRILEIEPGNAPRIHRTDSIDYAIVISGEIDMELEEGNFVHLNAGDVVVQRGTIHNWLNRGSEPCRIAFILIDAAPATVGGKVLNAVG